MSTINIGGREIPALVFAIALPVIGILYAADYTYFGYVTTQQPLMDALDKVATQESGVEDKKRQAQELKQRTTQIDSIKAETAALEKSITLLKAKIPSEAQVPVLLYDIERMAKASDGDLLKFEPQELKPYGSSPGSAPLPAPPTPAPVAPKPKPAAADSSSGSGGDEEGPAPAAGGTGGAATAGGPPPAPRPATADIMELPVNITATATYPQMIRLLDQLGTYERKLNVSNLQLSPSGGSKSGSSAGGEPAIFKNTLDVDFTLTAYVLKKSGGPQ